MPKIKAGSKPVCVKAVSEVVTAVVSTEVTAEVSPGVTAEVTAGNTDTTDMPDVDRADAGGASVARAMIEPEGFEFNDADLAALNARAGRGIVRGLVAQAVMGCIAVLVCWVVAGSAAGLSALAGAGAYFVPNALFAARLLLGLFGTSRPSALGFFLGEAFKLGLAVLLLGLAASLGGTWLVWPAFLLGLLCVLKGYVLLLAVRKLR